MRFDTQSMFSDEQVLSGSSNVDSEKVVDILAAGVAETPCFIAVRVANVANLKSVSLMGKETEGGSFAEVLVAAVAENGSVNIPVPQGLPRYLKLVYVPKTGSMSGKATAGFVLAVDSVAGKRIGNYEANV